MIRKILLLCLPLFAIAKDVKSETYSRSPLPLYRPTPSKPSAFCSEEPFKFSYITAGGQLEPALSRWPRTRGGQFAELEHICLRPNGQPLRRFCDPNWGAWQPIFDVKCLKATREPIVTLRIKEIYDRTSDAEAQAHSLNITSQLVTAFDRPYRKIIPADVFYTSGIMRKIARTERNVETASNMLDVCQRLMCANKTVLRLSGDLNATNELLDSFESYMDELPKQLPGKLKCLSANSSLGFRKKFQAITVSSFDNYGAFGHLSENISVFFINPNCANVSGIAVYSNRRDAQYRDPNILYEENGKYFFRFLFMNESIDDVMMESDLEAAVFLPPKVIQHVDEEFRAVRKELNIVIKIYANDALFVESTDQYSLMPSSKILSISIPHHYGQFPRPLYFILKNENYGKQLSGRLKDRPSGCGYWKYSTWVQDDVKTEIENAEQQPLIKCSTIHLTQFSFLLSGNYRQNDLNDPILISPMHQKVLDFITLFGCSLSLAGLLGIWLTAALFKSWRSQASTKVLLNMCVVLTLQMILFVFVNTDKTSQELVENGSLTKCIVIGALLQYSILVLFTWTLIIAFLQFQRYVTVIGIKRPRHYILKSAIAAWSFPLIPTLLVAFLDPQSYIPTESELHANSGICYPSGPGLHFGVILPVTLVCIVNLIIFIYVFYSISQTLSESTQRHEKLLVVRQIRLSILLYFLLGLSWIFGILSFLHAGTIFSYLFCLTATLQGFVMFVYFVLLDDIARAAWAKLLCRTKTSTKHKATLEDQSITYSSRLEN